MAYAYHNFVFSNYLYTSHKLQTRFSHLVWTKVVVLFLSLVVLVNEKNLARNFYKEFNYSLTLPLSLKGNYL